MAWATAGNIKGPDGTAATIAVGTVTTGSAGSSAQVTNSGNDTAATFNFVIPKGDKGDDGAGVAIAGTVATYAALPTDLTTDNAGDGYFVQADGDLYVWDGSDFPAEGSGIEFQGPPGDAATVTVGDVVTGAAGTSVVVTNSGSSSAAVFNFTIPRGDAGAAGSAATLAVGTVTTGSPGSSATVTNSGTSSAAVFDISIPAGADGADGSDGSDGTNGTKWFNGTGAPSSVPGAVAGDYYLDTADGTVYVLS